MSYYDKRYDGIKAFMIARVSDPSQREALPAQKYKLTDYQKRLNFNAEYHEFDESAFKEDREKFENSLPTDRSSVVAPWCAPRADG